MVFFMRDQAGCELPEIGGSNLPPQLLSKNLGWGWREPLVPFVGLPIKCNTCKSFQRAVLQPLWTPHGGAYGAPPGRLS